MWIGVLWAGLRVAMWITHVGDKFRHALLEKSPKDDLKKCLKMIWHFRRNISPSEDVGNHVVFG